MANLNRRDAMPKKRYVVKFTPEERSQVLALLKRGHASVRKITRAQVLLLADEGRTDAQIIAALNTSRPRVERLRKRFVDGGLDAALNERHRPGAPRKLSGRDEALLVALTCSDPPEGRACWTMQLLADRMVELDVVESLSDETVRRCLKKRLEALAEGAVVHSQRGRRVRLRDGRRAGAL
jgi:transposase